MEMDDYEGAMRLARALSDPARIRIAAALTERDQTLEDLATSLGLRLPDVSRHLRVLSDNQLVREHEADGMTRFQLDLEEIQRISRSAFARRRPSSPEIDGDDWEQKVLRDFVKDERLTSIPSSLKKRLVILRWLATQFPANTRLSEREVSTWLEQFHSDFATLRRELVDNHLLERDHGIYWRPTDDGQTTY